jgi:hypothetical protein
MDRVMPTQGCTSPFEVTRHENWWRMHLLPIKGG